MRNSPISCKPPPHSNWRDDCKTCPVCGEKYWPAETTTRKNWLVKKYCSNACNAKAASVWRHQKPAAKNT